MNQIDGEFLSQLNEDAKQHIAGFLDSSELLLLICTNKQLRSEILNVQMNWWWSEARLSLDILNDLPSSKTRRFASPTSSIDLRKVIQQSSALRNVQHLQWEIKSRSSMQRYTRDALQFFKHLKSLSLIDAELSKEQIADLLCPLVNESSDTLQRLGVRWRVASIDKLSKLSTSFQNLNQLYLSLPRQHMVHAMNALQSCKNQMKRLYLASTDGRWQEMKEARTDGILPQIVNLIVPAFRSLIEFKTDLFGWNAQLVLTFSRFYPHV